MKVFLRVLCAIVVWYIFISMALSFMVTIGIGRTAIRGHRAPFLLVDFGISKVEGFDEENCQIGYNQHDEQVRFCSEVMPGDVVLTVKVYNPMSNDIGDVSKRIDKVI